MTIGWIVVSFFTMFVALGMAEIVSAIPTGMSIPCNLYWPTLRAAVPRNTNVNIVNSWRTILLVSDACTTKTLSFRCVDYRMVSIWSESMLGI
jgi:hypothetical protein